MMVGGALSPGYRVARWGYLAFCVAAFVFLIAPILVLVPLSFNAEPYFTFTEGMLRFDPEAYSLRWYRSIFDGDEWTRPARQQPGHRYLGDRRRHGAGRRRGAGPGPPRRCRAARSSRRSSSRR